MTRAATASFDPSAKGAAATLSGSNLVATVSSGTGAARATHPISGLTYFEAVMGATLSGSCRIGLASQSFTLTTLLGAAATAVGYDKGGTVVINGATVATIAAYVATNRIGVAINWQRQLIWFRVNGGNWNNDVIANQNPVGSVGGISLATLTSGATLFPAWAGSATSSTTIRFASASWTDAAPTGFVSLDTEGASAVINSGGNADPTGYEAGINTSVPTVTVIESCERAFQPGNATSPLGDVHVSGEVKVAGIATTDKIVRAYDADTGEFLGEVSSDQYGEYTLAALGRDNVYVVAFNPTTYRALVYDQIVPA